MADGAEFTPPTDITKPFTDAIAEAERLVASAEFIRTEQDLAEGYEYLAGGIRAVVQLAWAFDKRHPYFVSSTGPYTKMGLDNPDTLYYSANIVDDAEYVVTGKRGSTTDLAFQIIAGQYTADEVPAGDQAFDDRALEIEEDGSFVVRFGPPKENAGPNYFALAPGATTLSVREVYSDWNAEHKGSIRIERVDTIGTAPVEPDIETLTKRYRVAGKMLLSRINTWFNFPKWFYLDLPVNTFTEPRLTPGGLATQFSSVGHYDLADDEAMIITVPKSAAPYQGFQLGSMWYISLDYSNHQTSLNSSQAQVDPDGNIRMVLTRSNPGLANWIETTGRQRGILQFRWQRTDSPITANQGPTAQVVALSDVPQHLPYYEDNRIDEAGWNDRIAKRQRGFAERMLG